jgi:hypothetical protein
MFVISLTAQISDEITRHFASNHRRVVSEINSSLSKVGLITISYVGKYFCQISSLDIFHNTFIQLLIPNATISLSNSSFSSPSQIISSITLG